MKLSDTEAKVKAAAEELDTDKLLAKLREYERAGQRSQSMSDGRGGGETPCPVACVEEDPDWVATPRAPGSVPWNRPSRDVIGTSDTLDRDIRTDRLLLESGLAHMLNGAQTVLGIQRKYLNARTTDAEKLETLSKPPKGAGLCGNVWCDHDCTGVGDDRLRKSTRPGDDPSKAPIARCAACDKHWRRHGTERDLRVRAVPSPQSAVARV